MIAAISFRGVCSDCLLAADFVVDGASKLGARFGGPATSSPMRPVQAPSDRIQETANETGII